MPLTPVASKDERETWELLTRNFQWKSPEKHRVKVAGTRRSDRGRGLQFQIFEVVVTVILREIEPQFDWLVTPNRADDGLDFFGEQPFLRGSGLGIKAALTVGGQCKKRERVNEVLDALFSDLGKMADKFDPSMFVVAFAANVSKRRLDKASGVIHRQLHRRCHILDRPLIESLMADHVDLYRDILHEGLEPNEVRHILDYLGKRRHAVSPVITPSRVDRVLAGESFKVDVTVEGTVVSKPGARLWWRPRKGGAGVVRLLGPVQADSPGGAALAAAGPFDDPLRGRYTVELISHTVGRVDLGEVLLGSPDSQLEEALEPVSLGEVQVVENVRPRFFPRPVETQMARLYDEYDRALTGAVVSVKVVGPGGSGKSRLCEEFSLGKRRRGCQVVSAKHAQTRDDPHHVFRDLLYGLTTDELLFPTAAETVVNALSCYNRSFAQEAASTIDALFGRAAPTFADDVHDTIVNALVLLIAARSRRGPIIVHVQDLHWAGTDVLRMLEDVLWELRDARRSESVPERSRRGGVMFLFEGRVDEKLDTRHDWTSEPFEAFPQRSEETTLECSSFDGDDRRAFIRLLFESRDMAHRRVPDAFLKLQMELIERIDATAGGNPFHSLEQVRLLRDRKVLAQNPQTGFVYLIQAPRRGYELPPSVSQSIERRWRYLRDRKRDLALLVWACALLEARVPAQLFDRLRDSLAPGVSRPDVDGTEILWTGATRGRDVEFRHEHYFRFIQDFEVSEEERDEVVDIYRDWFEGLRRPSPADRFSTARVLLKRRPVADMRRVRTLLATALRGANRQGDQTLSRRIRAFQLDREWEIDRDTPLAADTFIRRCDDEIAFSRDLLSIDRVEAAGRLEALRERIRARLVLTGQATRRRLAALEYRNLAAEVVYSELLFNAGDPAEAAEVIEGTIAAIRTQRPASTVDGAQWDSLEMEALYAQSCARALSGDGEGALHSSERAVQIAQGSASPLSRRVISTHANILIGVDTEEGEELLRGLLPQGDQTSDAFLVEVHLTRALVLKAHRCGPHEVDRRRALLEDARQRLNRVYTDSDRLGLHPDAGAAALMRGIVAVLMEEKGAWGWFAQAVASAARGRQMETLWRSHLNLATALYQSEARVSDMARDHAVAALEIMSNSLTSADPDQSPRFEALRIPMIHAVRFLLEVQDDAGMLALERYPALRAHFRDVSTGALAEGEPPPGGYTLIRLGDEDYILY